MQPAPLPVVAEDGEGPFGLVYNVPEDASVSDIRSAIQSQLKGKTFELLGADGRTPLHPMQERILLACDVWGTSPQVRLRWVATPNPRKGGWRAPASWWHGLYCFALPLAIAAATSILGLAIGTTGLVLAHVAGPPIRQHAGAGLDGPSPADDRQYYLDTFRKTWQATLDALVNMIDTYLNGPIMSLCNTLDHIVSTVKECVLCYLHVFQACFEHALDPALAPLLIGMTVAAFLGTAVVVHVVMRDLRRWLPWSQRRWLDDSSLEPT
eukprot:CAMPEP_0175663070 /NCGR_PEP_ID=MMETSP0097-20121207/15806_1 /TAXON_ID=311494 /ORGANISM="Alexandrium monilatum, Strain CCMP3105" /LENGTH=266 /DNA_ID=CAMNT_0016969305 /DNA_START=28 /DNA_END=824 /DNA_ORIENTATION=-